MLQVRLIARHIKMLILPVIIGAGAAALWYFVFFLRGINVGKADETAITNTLIPVLATFHAIIAAAVLSKVWEEFKSIRRCVRDNDEAEFFRCLEDRIPITIHLLLAAMSLLIVASAMLVQYEHASAGLLVVGGLGFVLTLYWQVATNLDNPLCGVWYADEIPAGWRQRWDVREGEK